MQKHVKTKADERFAVTQKKAMQALSDKQKEQRARSELTAKLRALRLAKEDADKKAAGQ